MEEPLAQVVQKDALNELLNERVILFEFDELVDRGRVEILSRILAALGKLLRFGACFEEQGDGESEHCYPHCSSLHWCLLRLAGLQALNGRIVPLPRAPIGWTEPTVTSGSRGPLHSPEDMTGQVGSCEACMSPFMYGVKDPSIL